MRIEVCGRVAPPVVRISGDLDCGSSPEVARALREVVKPGVRELILDLALVRNADFGGIATLIQISKGLRKHGGTLYLASLSRQLRRLLRIAKLADFFPTYESLEAARAGHHRATRRPHVAAEARPPTRGPAAPALNLVGAC